MKNELTERVERLERAVELQSALLDKLGAAATCHQGEIEQLWLLNLPEERLPKALTAVN